LEEDNNKLRDQLQTKGKIILRDSCYWIQDSEKLDGPYCTRCWDKNKDMIRLNPTYLGSPYAVCPECKNSYQTREDESAGTSTGGMSLLGENYS
ncbi:TPA: hypothetical protein DCR79_00480, partial [Patescibacteria group bacterium]|nr:hypothetical protein [Patescibacteria group bacterium]